MGFFDLFKKKKVEDKIELIQQSKESENSQKPKTKEEQLGKYIEKKKLAGDDWGLRSSLIQQGYSGELIDKILKQVGYDNPANSNLLNGISERDTLEDKRREGRRKNSFGKLRCNEGYFNLMESGNFDYSMNVKVIEGEVNKKVLNSRRDMKTMEITPKTKEAFVEVQKGNSRGKIVNIQSVYLIKNKRATKEVFL